MDNSRKRVKVWDAEGNELHVAMVDAREIIAAGGSSDEPVAEKKAVEAKPHPAEVVVEDKPKKSKA